VKVEEEVDNDVEKRRPIYRHFIFCSTITHKGSKSTMETKDPRPGHSTALC
jgi:hypothetical protein